MPGGNLRPASEWLASAKAIFDSALERASDTPDDPTAPTIDESLQNRAQELAPPRRQRAHRRAAGTQALQEG
jgi:hypothetical protein